LRQLCLTARVIRDVSPVNEGSSLYLMQRSITVVSRLHFAMMGCQLSFAHRRP
jgi:hypothetical protein